MKQILCYGDSNTYGYDSREYPATGKSGRFDESVRWTCLLQKDLGDSAHVYEAGMGGRTTVFEDPLEYGRNGYTFLDVAFKSNEPLDLIIVMLGTNDIKDQFAASAGVIASGMERLIIRLKELISESHNPAARILLVSPVNVTKTAQGGFYYDFSEESISKGLKLGMLYQEIAIKHDCAFADANQWLVPDESDGTHFNPEGHRIFAEKISVIVRQLLNL
ncbi:GDSL-type esterase/lipase family protein [Flexilinea flocculi]|jgi:lysophospholipase L1-like esterase|uniref:Lysophospholipase L1 n=1 Tax=Flexilinea flocculi TaxID=1678840 RepID=A0A0S7BM79_9CHLR|nr:GDSL-type esterase/lipase family protein [Flexilinea flocculi]GAP41468.1 lysophospholipase L1 [Flexilinea flocculi]